MLVPIPVVATVQLFVRCTSMVMAVLVVVACIGMLALIPSMESVVTHCRGGMRANQATRVLSVDLDCCYPHHCAYLIDLCHVGVSYMFTTTKFYAMVG